MSPVLLSLSLGYPCCGMPSILPIFPRMAPPPQHQHLALSFLPPMFPHAFMLVLAHIAYSGLSVCLTAVVLLVS